jgi:hypothetical protein
MTYDELVVAVTNYCETTFTTVDMDTFIRQAEQRIYNVAQPANQRTSITGTITANNKYLACPDDFISVFSLAIYPAAGGAYTYLLDKDVNFMREAYPTPTETGTPRHYALFGPQSADAKELTFILGPTPDTAYSTELHYFAYPQSIVDSPTGRTWLGDNFDTVLFYGTLCETLVYMRQEVDMVKLVNDRYLQAVALYKNMADGKQRGDAYRDGQVRVSVS